MPATKRGPRGSLYQGVPSGQQQGMLPSAEVCHLPGEAASTEMHFVCYVKPGMVVSAPSTEGVKFSDAAVSNWILCAKGIANGQHAQLSGDAT